jgi:hypothetical protein
LLRNKLLLATTNQGKAKEIKSFLEELSLEIFTLQELSLKKTFPECGKTFAENARPWPKILDSKSSISREHPELYQPDFLVLRQQTKRTTRRFWS